MNFRRCILAMAVLSMLFVGLASAQVNDSGAGTSATVQCVANVAVPPQLRSEGLTELIGDIVITCTGGNPVAVGNTIPVANITVSLGTNVTSRLLGGSVSNASEAVLLIDEPNTQAPGTVVTGTGTAAGSSLPYTLCGTPGVGAGPGGCVQAVSGPLTSGTCAVFSTTTGLCTSFGPAANVYQGLVNVNQVTFLGVPVNPPTTAGVARVYRITNIRANVSAIGAGGFAGTQPLLASVSISGSTSLPVSNPVLTAGFIQAGLNTGLRNVANTGGGSSQALAQCGGGGPFPLSILRYSENFGTAFKTRVAPSSIYNGQSSTPTLQNRPGTIYNSESGLVLYNPSGGNVLPAAGLADYGTRVKATFENVPAGVRLFVSTANVLNGFVNPITQPSVVTSSYAQLVISETAQDANGFPPLAVANASFTGFGSATINIAEIPIVNGTGTAVWEVIQTNPNALESLDFGVYQQFTANPGANSPPVGTATVTMSYAPTAGPTTFTASAGAAASASLTIPRFTTGGASASNIFNIALCQTVLLFPFVTNQLGFDTGLAIANTTTDPFGTRNQAGTCTLNFYGASAPPAFTTPNVATATVYVNLASVVASGFQGYMIAVCNFQLAHGFAFVSDLGARNLAMGYLALIVPTGTGNRNNRTEALDN